MAGGTASRHEATLWAWQHEECCLRSQLHRFETPVAGTLTTHHTGRLQPDAIHLLWLLAVGEDNAVIALHMEAGEAALRARLHRLSERVLPPDVETTRNRLDAWTWLHRGCCAPPECVACS